MKYVLKEKLSVLFVGNFLRLTQNRAVEKSRTFNVLTFSFNSCKVFELFRDLNGVGIQQQLILVSSGRFSIDMQFLRECLNLTVKSSKKLSFLV